MISPGSGGDAPHCFVSPQRLYHVPGQRYYNQTVISPSKGERYFCSEWDAWWAGWRKSKGLEVTMAIEDVQGWLVAGKTALDLLKSALPFLPKGKDRDEIERKIEQATEALARSDAALAKQLGYTLCQCTFPPQIMLWDKATRKSVCPKCNDRSPQDPPMRSGGGGPHSWMGV
jgi:hypothetical protein